MKLAIPVVVFVGILAMELFIILRGLGMNINSFGSICSGVGMQEMAYKEVFNDNIKYFAEIDKFAIKSYNAIHGDIKNLGDFTKAEDVERVDFMFASTPCQDFSVSGKQKGFDGMRGTLTFEWVKMLRGLKEENKMPKVIGFENVPGIIFPKFIKGFELFKNELENLGYKLHQKKLNAKNYGIPQNRERVFLIGFLQRTNFEFPKKIELKDKLKDILEFGVEEKYYLNKSWHFLTEKDIPNDVNEIAQVDGISYKATRSITSVDMICRCLDTMGGGQREPKILDNDRLRKLTPKECWRIMGIKDEYFHKATAVNSNSQLYKQAGNGIVVNVLVEIFKEIKKAVVVDEKEIEPGYDIVNGEKQFRLFK